MKALWLFLLLSINVGAEVKAVGVFYFNPFLGHVHQSPARRSPSLTTIQCGHPLKVIEDPNVTVSDEWSYVSVADWKGFVWKKHLTTKRPDCFQSRYPKFYDALSLDLAELFYWGRLHDHWEEGVAKP
ncbi:MAG: SH3 domain-containing protein [Bacteriovoracaceae bacterium]|nr:SH3 domain-containing protein [Bacteriovoracaceae bacterium]